MSITVLLALMPLYPLVSFFLLIVLANKLSWLHASLLSVSAILLCALSSLVLFSQLSVELPKISVTLWQWLTLATASGGIEQLAVGFHLDALSGVMICVVSCVGLLIHIFAAQYMREDENYSRFMAYMNLFISAMLVLVLADNLVLLYLGWEGVGLCSFLLIGFWYQEPNNVAAAKKAFIVTRVGDTALAIGLFMLFAEFQQLGISDVNSSAQAMQAVNSSDVNADSMYWICLCLLIGAAGKSAQLPLQTWLPDAMAGPTPVSALIHAATMVTAGVYLIARLYQVFLQAPQVMVYIAFIGAFTLLLAACAALAQKDIKRILAYSTMSQIGYMVLALGVGAFSASIYHLVTHAFFKALLFLTAGTVIYAMHHQQDIFKMGGLLKRLPFESACFFIGLICLIALPGTSGFFSKEAILTQLWLAGGGSTTLWLMALLGALLTSIYSCRLFYLAFLGESRSKTQLIPSTGILIRTPLLILVLLSLLGGIFASTIDMSLAAVFTEVNNLESSGLTQPLWSHALAIAMPFIGIFVSWFLFSSYRKNQLHHNVSPLFLSNNFIVAYCQQGLGFDYLYKHLFVRPYCAIARLNRGDVIDSTLMLIAKYIALWHELLSASQNGNVRWYAAALAVALTIILFLSGLHDYGVTLHAALTKVMP